MFACSLPHTRLNLLPFSHECPIGSLHVQLSTEMRKREMAHTLGIFIISSRKDNVLNSVTTCPIGKVSC